MTTDPMLTWHERDDEHRLYQGTALIATVHPVGGRWASSLTAGQTWRYLHDAKRSAERVGHLHRFHPMNDPTPIEPSSRYGCGSDECVACNGNLAWRAEREVEWNAERLADIRRSIEAEEVSQAELAELADLAEHIDPDDLLLLEWAGVPELPEVREVTLTVSFTFEVCAEVGYESVAKKLDAMIEYGSVADSLHDVASQLATEYGRTDVERDAFTYAGFDMGEQS